MQRQALSVVGGPLGFLNPGREMKVLHVLLCWKGTVRVGECIRLCCLNLLLCGLTLLLCDAVRCAVGLSLLPAALQTGAIKGAGLDVFAVEPLPQESPLWGLPNVYMTPHSTARTTRFMHDNVDLFVDNLQRYIAGHELLNVVDKTMGY